MTKKFHKKSFVALLAMVMLLSFPSWSAAQDMTVRAYADTNAMLIGDQVHLNLEMTLHKGDMYRFPQIGDTITGNMPVISRTRIDTIYPKGSDQMILTQKIRFTSFDSGYYLIPSFEFQFVRPPDTTVHSVLSEPLTILVHTVSVDTTEAIKPIKEPLKIPITFREMLPWILAIVAVLLIIAAGIYILWKRRKAQPVFQLRPKIKLKPWESAIIELEKLKVKKLWQNNRSKDYYTELTEILRKYLEERYDIMAMEKTSAEILYELGKGEKMSSKALDLLEEILTLADMVKFAKAEPHPDEHESSMDNSFRFIDVTTPSETETKQETEGKQA